VAKWTNGGIGKKKKGGGLCRESNAVAVQEEKGAKVGEGKNNEAKGWAKKNETNKKELHKSSGTMD